MATLDKIKVDVGLDPKVRDQLRADLRGLHTDAVVLRMELERILELQAVIREANSMREPPPHGTETDEA